MKLSFKIITGFIAIVLLSFFIYKGYNREVVLEDNDSIIKIKPNKQALLLITTGGTIAEKKRPIIQEEVGEQLILDKHYYKKDERLKPEEEKKFFAEVSQVFLEDRYSMLDQEKLMDRMVRLNERYRRGVRSSLQQLLQPTKTREDALIHVALIDYLTYRLQFDERLPEDLVELLSSPIRKDAPIKEQAGLIVDKVELMRALANAHWDHALQTIAKIEDKKLAQRLALAAYGIRVSKGFEKEIVMDDIKYVLDDFMPFSS